MTLYKVIDLIKILALKHPNVNSAEEGDIYSILNANQEHKYATIVLTQDTHTEDEVFDNYNLNIFYVDRLFSDIETNRLDIQSTAKNVLSNIIRAFCEEFDAECNSINYHTFTERFVDECAGAYAAITISIPKDIYCTEKYWDETWATPLITVRNQNKSVEFTANGTYTVTYDATNYSGLGKVEIEVNVPDLNGSFDDGYSEGKEDGIQEGYADGKQDGYTEGFDTGKNQGLEEGYADGKADGIEEGYSQGKTDGFNEGKAEGYTDGKEDGISEQKAKLESISISENGTYTKEDGYNSIVVEIADTNGSYDEGYDAGYSEGVEEGTSNAGAIIAETAQVLNITENGLYSTKYSKDEDFGREVTGYFDDGTPLYNYAYLKGKVFKTDALLTRDSKIEVWWKPSYEWGDNYYGDGIVGTIEPSYGFSLRIKKGISFAGSVFSANDTIKEINLENKWYHLSFSYDEGLFVDGEFCGKQTTEPYPTQGVEYGYINLTKVLNNYNQANGYFGMVKIDDNIYIPTQDGFINYYTKEPLEVYQDGKYNFDEIPESDGNLIRTVNVNVVPKINIQKEGITFAFSKITEVPEWADWSNIRDMERMFSYCDNLKNIKLIDTSNVVNMNSMCYKATKITTIPAFDTSNVTDMFYMFYGCSSLLSIPLLNTSNVSNFTYFINGCSKLASFPAIDTSNAVNIDAMFGGCTSLTTIPPLNAGKVTSTGTFFGYSELKNLTNFGGLVGLKTKWDDNYGLVKVPNLTYESCINVLNGLYDFVGNGETPTYSQGKLKVHANFLTTVGDELSIGTNKGWTITA